MNLRTIMTTCLMVLAVAGYAQRRQIGDARTILLRGKEFDKAENRTGINAPTFQFMRIGFFCMDNRDSSADHLVFNRSVSLKDSFKK